MLCGLQLQFIIFSSVAEWTKQIINLYLVLSEIISERVKIKNILKMIATKTFCLTLIRVEHSRENENNPKTSCFMVHHSLGVVWKFILTMA